MARANKADWCVKIMNLKLNRNKAAVELYRCLIGLLCAIVMSPYYII